jgi:hypothetical protein
MLKRAWIMVNRDRTVIDPDGIDRVPPDRLVDHLRTLCFGAGSVNSAACFFAQTYGRDDAVVAVEWDTTDLGRGKLGGDDLLPLDEAVMAIDHPHRGKDHSAGVAQTKTLIRIHPHEARPNEAGGRYLTRLVASGQEPGQQPHVERVLLPVWGDRVTEPMAFFVGIRVKGGQHPETMEKVVRRLDRAGLNAATVDSVFGPYDIFVAVAIDGVRQQSSAKKFLHSLREVSGIRRTETLFSHRFVFPE